MFLRSISAMDLYVLHTYVRLTSTRMYRILTLDYSLVFPTQAFVLIVRLQEISLHDSEKVLEWSACSICL